MARARPRARQERARRRAVRGGRRASARARSRGGAGPALGARRARGEARPHRCRRRPVGRRLLARTRLEAHRRHLRRSGHEPRICSAHARDRLHARRARRAHADRRPGHDRVTGRSRRPEARRRNRGRRKSADPEFRGGLAGDPRQQRKADHADGAPRRPEDLARPSRGGEGRGRALRDRLRPGPRVQAIRAHRRHLARRPRRPGR